MPILYLVRHGQASFGQENYDQLSALGEKQSKAVGQLFAAQRIIPGQAHSGTLVRQRETARIALAAANHDLQISESIAFNEYDSKGVFENYLPPVLDEHPAIRDMIKPDDYDALKDRRIFQTLFFPVMQHWITGQPATRAPMEPFDEFRKRVVGGLNQLTESMDDSAPSVLFTSGGVISVILAEVIGLGWQQIADFNWRTANASISRLEVSDRGLKLDGYNHHAHSHDPDNGLKVTYL